MGVVLDSSVLIAGERKGKNARQVLSEIAEQVPGEDVALSVVTVMELMHGAVRADSPERRAMRQQFLSELISAVPVHAVTVSVALRAGQIDGENAARGVRVALADLLIGVTAIELDYWVATSNVRHFNMIRHLNVMRI